MEFNEYRHHGIALPTLNDVFQCDFRGILRLDHVEYFIFDVIEIHWFSTMRLDLLLNSLSKQKSIN